jgi:hypothetical protein
MLACSTFVKKAHIYQSIKHFAHGKNAFRTANTSLICEGLLSRVLGGPKEEQINENSGLKRFPR